MNIKKLIIGGIVGGIIFFLVGYLEYVVILGHFFATHHSLPEPVLVYRPQPLLQFIFLGNLSVGFLLSFVLLKIKPGSLLDGAIVSAVVGLLLCASVDFNSYGITVLMSLKAILVEMCAYTLMAIIAGAVITFIFSKMKPE
jgi:hypothetical protein